MVLIKINILNFIFIIKNIRYYTFIFNSKGGNIFYLVFFFEDRYGFKIQMIVY